MRHLVSAGLLIAALIHLLPLAGALGPERLGTLYGLRFDEPNLQILMRHRAVLFGIVGGLLLAAIFMPSLRIAALVVGLVSVLSFLLLAWQIGGANAQIARVVMADWIALVALLIGLGTELIIVQR